MAPPIRPDLAEAHERAWASLAAAGTWWSAPERRALARTAIAAMWSEDPDPVGSPEHAPPAAHRAAAELARGASTINRAWYERVRDEIGALAYVELVGLVCVAAATTSFRHTLGGEVPDLPEAPDEGPSRADPPELAEARWNWVPVAAPADATAAVVQALTAVPSAFASLWNLADVQYIPDAEMVDPRWTRGTLSRVEMELVATKVSFSRECHY